MEWARNYISAKALRHKVIVKIPSIFQRINPSNRFFFYKLLKFIYYQASTATSSKVISTYQVRNQVQSPQNLKFISKPEAIKPRIKCRIRTIAGNTILNAGIGIGTHPLGPPTIIWLPKYESKGKDLVWTINSDINSRPLQSCQIGSSQL